MTHFSVIYAGNGVVILSWRGILTQEALFSAAEEVARRISAARARTLALHFYPVKASKETQDAFDSFAERIAACGVKTVRVAASDAFVRMIVSSTCLKHKLRYEFIKPL